jgi:twinkle protein
MTTLPEKLIEHGIRLRSHGSGSHKVTCPKCSHTRRAKHDPCLSVTIDSEGGAVWNCHHCSWSGRVSEQGCEEPTYRRPRRAPPVKPRCTPDSVTPGILAWFANRQISETVVRRNRIGAARTRLPAAGAEVDCIEFPYYRDAGLVNVKFRALASKAFSQVKGAEKILYGLDDIADSKTAIFVEGECDKLALEEAGIRNVVSVPDGAPVKLKDGDPRPDDPKFEYLANSAEHLDRLEKIILAGDDDAPGRVLQEELARRLGKERCWRVRWPDSGDAPCKDANQVLQIHGPQVLAECIAMAQPYPIAGLHSVHDFGDETLALYHPRAGDRPL